MEIHIRLAGVQLGPYSEKQVKEYLAEGLLAPTDLACAEGSDQWTAVTDLLTKLNSPSDTARMMAVPPDSGPAPRRAPDAPPGVTHLPPKIQESKPVSLSSAVDASGKKTVLGPNAPSIPSRTGQTSSSQTATAPLRAGTKKVARASLVKALAQKTAPLPAKPTAAPTASPTTAAPSPLTSTPPPSGLPAPSPIRAPAADPSAPTGVPPQKQETNHAALPSLMKALTAKTTPMRTSAPTQPSPLGKSPATTPLPSKSAIKAAMETSSPPSVAPPSVAKALSKKLGRVSLPEAQTSPPTLGLTLGTDSPPPTTTIKEPVSTIPPAANETEGGEENDKPPAPRRHIALLIYGCAVLAILMIYYVWSPYHASASLRQALSDGDPAALESSIDFASVRDSLKQQVQAQLPAANGQNKGSAIVLAMIDNSIDRYITPTGIADLVKRSDGGSSASTTAPKDPTQMLSSDTAGKILLEFNSQPVQNQGLASVTDFVVNIDVALMHLRFGGIRWKLKQIELRPDLLSSGASADGVSPLLLPVVDTYLERAGSLAKNGKAREAIVQYSQVIAIDPKSSMAYAARGLVRQSANDLHGAIADYTQALTLDPKMAAAYNDRGNAKAAQNDLDGALADFSQAIRFNPGMASAYDSRGNARTAKDDLEGAIKDFTEAIAAGPDDPNLANFYSDRGFARQANGNLDGAIADYTEALVLKPKTAVAYYNRGLARQSQGNLEAAIVDYDRALAFDPKLAGAYYNRGNAKNASHDLDGAIADFTQALAINPKIALAYCNRGLARQAKGDLDGAITDYTQALAIDPKIAIAYYDRGLIKEQKNDLDGAIADSTQAIDLDSTNAQAYYNRGFAKLTKGNLEGALADLKQFCNMAPTDHYADHARLYLWLIAKAQNSKNDPDQELSDALLNGWNSSGDDMATKTAAFLLGRLSEDDYLASAASSDVKTDQGQHCEAWYFAGMKRLLMGDKATAIAYFHKCLATNQSDFCEYILARAELQALEPPPGSSPAPAPAAMPTVPTPPAVAPATPPRALPVTSP